MIHQVATIIVTILMLTLVGCKSSDIGESMSAEDRFERGKQRFANKDYLEAIEDFSAVTLQYPGSAVADDAQYQLGECRFQREEYLLAAYEYEALKRSMPASPLVPMAQYKIGLCYYTLSPKPPLDQKYARRAIDEFQAFIEYYPTHELVPDAEAKIRELNNRLAEKDYRTGVLYMKMEYYKAALFYFDNVLEKYHDSDFAESAHYGKIEALYYRKKYQEARDEVDKFLARHPNSKLKSSVESMRESIEKNLKAQSVGFGTLDSTRLVRQQ